MAACAGSKWIQRTPHKRHGPSHYNPNVSLQHRAPFTLHGSSACPGMQPTQTSPHNYCQAGQSYQRPPWCWSHIWSPRLLCAFSALWSSQVRSVALHRRVARCPYASTDPLRCYRLVCQLRLHGGSCRSMSIAFIWNYTSKVSLKWVKLNNHLLIICKVAILIRIEKLNEFVTLDLSVLEAALIFDEVNKVKTA